jgi:hypothetical protein
MTDLSEEFALDADSKEIRAEWKRAGELISAILCNNESAKVLKKEMDVATSAAPVPLRRVDLLQRNLDRRAETRADLCGQLKISMDKIADCLKRIVL